MHKHDLLIVYVKWPFFRWFGLLLNGNFEKLTVLPECVRSSFFKFLNSVFMFTAKSYKIIDSNVTVKYPICKVFGNFLCYAYYFACFSLTIDENDSEDDSKLTLSFRSKPFVIFDSINFDNPA